MLNQPTCFQCKYFKTVEITVHWKGSTLTVILELIASVFL